AMLPTLAMALMHGSAPDDSLVLALGAVLALGLARRHAFAWGALASVGLGALACMRSMPALAIFGLAMAILAVALEKLPKLARALLRDEGAPASAPFAMGALLIPLVVGTSPEPAWLAL